MDYFTPGLRELGRKLHRSWLRLLLWQRRRQLGRAQTELGLLGWQQADFDPETQRQVDAINNVEREQGRLINEAAETSAAIRRQRSELEGLQREHQEKMREISQEQKKLRETSDDLERRLAERRKLEPNLERRMPELDRELREVTKLLAQLLTTDQQTQKVRQEIVRLRERSVTIPNEKNDLRTQHFRVVTEIRGLEDTLSQNEQAQDAQARRRHDLEAAWKEQEEKLTATIKERERDKSRLEKEIAALERAKVNPYQQIGRVLALAEVAPMNQPHALDEVKNLEFAMSALQEDLAASTRASASENGSILRLSYCLLGTIVAAIAVVLWAAL